MSRKRLEIIVLSVLSITVVALVWWRVTGDGNAEPAPAAEPHAATATKTEVRGQTAHTASVPVVSLNALRLPRPSPLETRRDPFRFNVRRPAPPPVGRLGAQAARVAPTPPVVVDPTAPPPAPPRPPITLKFIGIVQVPDRGLKLAVVSDSRGVYFGREGEVIEGRYRITRIGTESIVVTYLDGTGQRTIPLSGS